MAWRTGRIWRLGETELVVRRYNAPARIELRSAREDEPAIDAELAQRRAALGLHAVQLTHPDYHRVWA